MVTPRWFASILLAALIIPLYWMTPSAQSYGQTPSSAPYVASKELPYFTREKVKEAFELVKDSVTVFTDTLVAKDVLKGLAKFASLAPGCIGALFSVVNVVLAFLPQEDPVLNEIKDGFAEVNRKLDDLSMKISNLATDVEWFNYASIYSQDELRILNAWRKFEEFRENSKFVKSEEDKLRLVEIFTNYYEYTGTEASVSNLYHYLTVSSTSLAKNLNQLLIKKFKCDINEIGRYNVYFSSLLLRGTVLNEFYWRLIGFNQPNKEAKNAQMFNSVYRAQLSSVQYCLDNYTEYMKQDVREISQALSPDNKTAIAVQVKKALDKKYNWYKWVVVVYNTEKEKEHSLYRDQILSIPVGKISVAVGHTLKGQEPQRNLFKCPTQIDKCEITARFMKCEMPNLPPTTISNYPFFKVIHILNVRDIVEIPDPFLQIKCSQNWDSRNADHAVFAHYSRSLPVCDSVICKNGGRCKTILDSNDWLCECPDGYYGDTCEKKMESSKAVIPDVHLPVPNINMRLKMMESKLERKLEEIRKMISGMSRSI